MVSTRLRHGPCSGPWKHQARTIRDCCDVRCERKHHLWANMGFGQGVLVTAIRVIRVIFAKREHRNTILAQRAKPHEPGPIIGQSMYENKSASWSTYMHWEVHRDRQDASMKYVAHGSFSHGSCAHPVDVRGPQMGHGHQIRA